MSRKSVATLNSQSIGVDYYKSFERRIEREGVPNRLDVANEFGYWFSGLFDGEGSFTLRRRERSTHKTFLADIKIVLRDDDKECLCRCQRSLKVGKLYDLSGNSSKNPQVKFTVHKISDLAEVVVPLFDNYPLHTKKQNEYKHWRQAVMIIYRKTRAGTAGRKNVWSDTDWESLCRVENSLKRIRQYD